MAVRLKLSCLCVVFCRTVAKGLGDQDGYLFVIFLILLCVFFFSFSFFCTVGVVSSQPVFLISIHMQQRAIVEVNSWVVSLIKLVCALVLLHHYFDRFKKQLIT